MIGLFSLRDVFCLLSLLAHLLFSVMRTALVLSALSKTGYLIVDVEKGVSHPWFT